MDRFLFDATLEESHQAGFRLQYMEILNWGTFHEVRWRIALDGYNGLLTGDIGSGKSTLVDALTCLLVPHNKIVFNKAAGAESRERNLLSYVKGEYKKEKEEITKVAKKIYLRPDDNTYSVIIGNFHNVGYAENVCLAQIFWIGKDGKVEKLLVIGTRPLTIEEHFSGFSDINDLRRRLRKADGIQLFNDNFTQYSEHFRRQFGMNSDKAVDLFYQTVSMKSVSSLTEFVREQMLERTDVKEHISALLKRFDDLNKAHAAVVHAREQYHILKPLTEKCAEYGQISGEIEQTETMLEVAPSWFAQRKLNLLTAAIEDARRALAHETSVQHSLLMEKKALETRLLGILQDIDHHGGKRLEQIAEAITRHEQDKEIKRKENDDYQKLVSRCGLRPAEQEKDFLENIRLAGEMQSNCKVLESELRARRDHVVSELRKLDTDQHAEKEELASLQARKTQIPAWLIGFRARLCQDMDIPETELPFIGELLKVKAEEQPWEGAIERLLHDVGISMLVPQYFYKGVSQYVNNNMLKSPDGRGIKLTYLEADISGFNRVIQQLEPESVLHKIDIKPETPFYEWLENYLERSFGNCMCVTIDALHQVPYGITRQGLIKSGRIRHTKDDRKRLDDRRHYVLGWTNLEKIRALEESLSKRTEEIAALMAQKEEIESGQSDNDNLKQLLAILENVKAYSRINWQYDAGKINDLENERKELLTKSDRLAHLHLKKQEVEVLLAGLMEKETAVTEKVGSLKRDIAVYSEQQTDAGLLLQGPSEKLQNTWFPVIEAKMQDKKLSLRNIDSRQEEFRKQFQGENGELKKLRSRQTTLRSTVEKLMREIKEHSRAEYSEIPESIEASREYHVKFEKLESEDLKRHEDRFKEELNKNTINSIAVFDSQLEKHEKDIKQKIKTINQHLYEIVYNAPQDTYITIQMDATPNKEVRLFREELKKCYIHSFSSHTELYTEEKYEQVKRILDRFASPENMEKEWTQTVTDVRQWFEFNASERFRANNGEKEFYEGSGGKSGGQKEKLAYTILASALAYQFGLQFGEIKSRSFRFVVIDEAFGRGSDESTRYGLELFKKLNLQLLIVTPLQKLHVIDSHVNSFHFVKNRTGNYSDVASLTKEEYEKEKQRRKQELQMTTISPPVS